MIVTKPVQEVMGYIEYSYEFERKPFEHYDEDMEDTLFESDSFHSLAELLEKLQPHVIEEVREQNQAKRAWISHISFSGKSDDGETTASLSMTDRETSRGHVATKIDNSDIESRLLMNLETVKKIIDNTLEQYPVKY